MIKKQQQQKRTDMLGSLLFGGNKQNHFCENDQIKKIFWHRRNQEARRIEDENYHFCWLATLLCEKSAFKVNLQH